MLYAVYGLIFGLFIPYISRRFAKFMPATPAYAVYRILKQNRRAPKAKRKDNWQYVKLMSQYRWRSIIWGLLSAGLSYLAYWQWGAGYMAWALVFIWILLLLTEIDIRMELLPDLLTVPLLIAGFAFAVYGGFWMLPAESVMGAVIGYVIPVFASSLFVWKNQDAFGGGDIKLLSAVGAWLGVEKLMAVIILACVLFGLYALIMRKRQGAFGPAIAISAIVIAFYFF